MNEQYIAVRLIHDYILNRPPSTEKLNDRIVTQKIIYLASVIGVECGDFEFNWYKHGPYSPALTRVIYDNGFKDDYTQYRLKNESKEIITPLVKAISEKPKNMNEVDWIELLASFHFLDKKYGDIKKITNELVLLKPKYSNKDVLYTKQILDKYHI